MLISQSSFTSIHHSPQTRLAHVLASHCSFLFRLQINSNVQSLPHYRAIFLFSTGPTFHTHLLEDTHSPFWPRILHNGIIITVIIIIIIIIIVIIIIINYHYHYYHYFNLYVVNFVTKNDHIRLIANCSRNNFLSRRMYTQEMTSLFLSIRHTCRTIP